MAVQGPKNETIIYAQMTQRAAHALLFASLGENKKMAWLIRESAQPGCLSLDAVTRKGGERLSVRYAPYNENGAIVWKCVSGKESLKRVSGDRICISLNAQWFGLAGVKKTLCDALLETIQASGYNMKYYRVPQQNEQSQLWGYQGVEPKESPAEEESLMECQQTFTPALRKKAYHDTDKLSTFVDTHYASFWQEDEEIAQRQIERPSRHP